VDTPTSENPFHSTLRARRLRHILIGSGVVLAVVLGIVLYSSSRHSSIRIPNVGKDYTITLNGQAVKISYKGNDAYIPVYNGLYRLQITRPNYQPFTSDVTVSAGQESIVRPVFTLIPATQASAQAGIDYVRPSLDQKAIYYLGDARTRLYRMEIANQVHIPLTERALTGVADVQWSGNPDLALLVLDDGIYLQELLKYDFENQDIVKVAGPEVRSPVWDPTDSSRLAAAYFTEAGEKSLIIADKRFTQIDRKADLSSFTDPKLVWSPDGKSIMIINRSTNAADNDIWVYSVTQALLTKITTAGNVVDANFNTDGSAILYGQLDGAAQTLKVYNLSAQKETLLPVSSDVSRTAWRDSHSLFVPTDNNELQVVDTVTNSISTLSYTFPQDISIAGMYYYPKNGTLIFFSDSAVYTVMLEH